MLDLEDAVLRREEGPCPSPGPRGESRLPAAAPRSRARETTTRHLRDDLEASVGPALTASACQGRSPPGKLNVSRRRVADLNGAGGSHPDASN